MEGVRVDKWLWAARCFKSRTQATAACDGGHVEVNGAVARPSRLVHPEDVVEVRTDDRRMVYRVLALGEKRGPASVARLLYEDLTPPAPPRLPPPMIRDRGTGRPTKRERREIERIFDDEGF